MRKPQIKVSAIATRFHDRTIWGSGTLYLTSGGRFVLDKGWGEYFAKAWGDKPMFTLSELTSGIKKKVFINKIIKLAKDTPSKDRK